MKGTPLESGTVIGGLPINQYFLGSVHDRPANVFPARRHVVPVVPEGNQIVQLRGLTQFVPSHAQDEVRPGVWIDGPVNYLLQA